MRLDEYRVLMERSRRFYETALIQVEKEFYDLAAFSLEQSLQLFLKACLLAQGMDYPRTHSVRRLIRLLQEVTGKEELGRILEELGLELGALEDAYITSRYIPREYTKGEVKKLVNAVDKVIKVVREVVGC